MAIDWEEHYDKVARRWIEDAYPKPSQIPEILYHYTDAVGLASMMRSGMIWSTDYRFLNDQSELEYTRRMTRDIITDHMAKCDNDQKSSLYEGILEYHNTTHTHDTFVFSLSSERDDLSQWRGYAREGLGFTIGLSGKDIISASNDEKKFSFLRVDYDPEGQRNSLVKALRDFESDVILQCEKHPDDVDQIIDRASNNFAWCSTARSVSNKHKSFKSEGEWRFVTYIVEEYKKESAKTRVRGQSMVNYTEIGLGSEGVLPIVEIGIGPGFTGSEQFHAVEALCRETGYAPNIYSADTPYRRI